MIARAEVLKRFLELAIVENSFFELVRSLKLIKRYNANLFLPFHKSYHQDYTVCTRSVIFRCSDASAVHVCYSFD